MHISGYCCRIVIFFQQWLRYNHVSVSLSYPTLTGAPGLSPVFFKGQLVGIEASVPQVFRFLVFWVIWLRLFHTGTVGAMGRRRRESLAEPDREEYCSKPGLKFPARTQTKPRPWKSQQASGPAYWCAANHSTALWAIKNRRRAIRLTMRSEHEYTPCIDISLCVRIPSGAVSEDQIRPGV